MPLTNQGQQTSPSLPGQPNIPSSPVAQPPTQYPVSYQPTVADSGYVPQGKLIVHDRGYQLRSFGKLAFILLFVAGMVALSAALGPKIISSYASMGSEKDILLATSYKPVIWKDFGNVFEPEITLPVQYPVEGYQDVDFLLDSGAVVSSLPRDETKKLGISLAKLPRSTFSGFGGTISFAYRGKVKILLGEEEFLLPIVFTETAGTKPLLGRSGFFEQFSVYFNHKTKIIEIRK